MTTALTLPAYYRPRDAVPVGLILRAFAEALAFLALFGVLVTARAIARVFPLRVLEWLAGKVANQ